MILDVVKKEESAISPRLCRFVDQFVHDSYARFCNSMIVSGTKMTGYGRYRKVFSGSTTPMIVQAESDDEKAA